MAFGDWSDQRLHQTKSYLESAIEAGDPDIYDKEDERLQLDDINQEINRRNNADVGVWNDLQRRREGK